MIKRNNEELYKFIEGVKENFTEIRNEERSKANELGSKLYGDDFEYLLHRKSESYFEGLIRGMEIVQERLEVKI